VDWPTQGTTLERAPVNILGWCLFPGASVARVEVCLDGGPPQRARLAMERGELPGHTNHPDAPICAWELKVDLGALPPAAAGVRIDVTAHATDGRTARLAPAQYELAPPRSGAVDRGGHNAELRRRSVAYPHPAPPAGPDVRLLVVTHMLTYGGGSLYVLELLRRLTGRPGFACEVVSLADGPLRDEFEDAGIPVHITDGHPVASAARYEGHVAELVAWSATRGFNAAFVNTLGAFAGADVAARLRIPALWAVHESFPLEMFWFNAYLPGALDPYVRAQAEGAFRSASGVLFEAEATRRLFLDDADPARLVTLPYGVELDAIDAARASYGRADARRSLGIAPGARVVLCLGSIEPRKSQALLAQAFAQIADRHPDAVLALVGATEDGYCAAYRAALREYVERTGNGDRIRIEPVTDDPYRWHAAADVLACASDVESLPRVILEAMAFGTPVLSTRVFGVPELIDDGRTGYLCEMRDLADLSRTLDRVLGAPADELRAVGAAAAAHVRSRHDPDAYADAVLRLLRGLTVDPEALPGDLLGGAPAPAAPRAALSR
jgi:glycosyltransferase involved in cell wall biosynthesis